MDCFFSFNIVGLSFLLLPCRLVDLRRGLIVIVMTFWYVFRMDLTFFSNFLKLYFHLGLITTPMFLCSHDLCLFLSLRLILHTITWPREVIIILWSFRLWSSILWTHLHPHFLHTGDKDPYTQWAHGEYIVGTDNTWPQCTQWLKIGYILNVLHNGSTMYMMVKNWAHSECLLPLWPKCAH